MSTAAAYTELDAALNDNNLSARQMSGLALDWASWAMWRAGEFPRHEEAAQHLGLAQRLHDGDIVSSSSHRAAIEACKNLLDDLRSRTGYHAAYRHAGYSTARAHGIARLAVEAVYEAIHGNASAVASACASLAQEHALSQMTTAEFGAHVVSEQAKLAAYAMMLAQVHCARYIR